MDARAIEKLIYQQSGLLGVSGVSSDMRDAAGQRRPARQAGGGSYSSTASGASWVRWRRRSAVSTRSSSPPASASTRRDPRARLPRRGVARRGARRRGQRADGPRISTAASRVAAWVIPTNEELMIARHTRSANAVAAARIESEDDPRSHDAVALIPDGASLMIGGFMGVGTPRALIDELVRQGKRDLTVIANDTAMPGRGHRQAGRRAGACAR